MDALKSSTLIRQLPPSSFLRKGDALVIPDSGETAEQTSAAEGLRYFAKFDDGQWVDIDGLSLAFTVPTSNRQVGSPRIESATFNLGAETPPVTLLQTLLRRQVLTNVEILAVGSGGKGGLSEIERFAFNNVRLTGVVNDSGDETFNFDFESFRYRYQDANGKPFEVGANLVTGGRPGSSFTDGFPLDNLPLGPSDDPVLTHFVRFGDADPVELQAFELGFSALPNSRLSAQAVTLELSPTGVLTQVSESLFTGRGLPEVEIETYRPNLKTGKTELVDEYLFGDVRLTGYSLGRTDNTALSTLEFQFTSYTQTHLPTGTTVEINLLANA
jgi:hypothetical protein